MFVKRFKKILEDIAVTSLKLMGDVLMGQGMFGNYGRVGVVCSILDAMQDAYGLDRSEITQAVGLADSVVVKYLDCMIGNDLLSCQDNKYLITSEGGEYLDKFEELQSVIEGGENPDKFKDLPQL